MRAAGQLAEAGLAVPVEQWHLCAVDRLSVGRRIRMFHARATHDQASLEALERELQEIGGHSLPRGGLLAGAARASGAGACAGCGGGEPHAGTC